MLPHDKWGQPVQVVIGSGNRANLTAGVATSRTTLPVSTGFLVIVRSTDYFWLAFGSGSVNATADALSILVAPGEGIYQVPAGATNFAGLRVGSTDVVVQLESTN